MSDANLLRYATVKDYPYHQQAHRWLEDKLNSGKQVGLPLTSLLAFIRIGTNPKAFDRPFSIRAAWSQVREWLALPSVWIPLPTDRHAAVFGDLLQESEAVGILSLMPISPLLPLSMV